MKVGSKVSFRPAAGCVIGIPGIRGEARVREVSATVTYVNEKHRWFMAEYSVGTGYRKATIRECFKY